MEGILGCELDKRILTNAEVEIASEEQWELRTDGKVETVSARLRFFPNLRFSFRAFAKAFDVQDYQLDVRTPGGWFDLQLAVKVRDRLMHPKRATDFEITDSEIATCRRALQWYDNESSRLIEQAAARMEVGGE